MNKKLRNIILILISIVVMAGCQEEIPIVECNQTICPDCPTYTKVICETCNNTIIEKEIIKEVYINQTCPEIDPYNLTLPFVLQIKSLDRQLSECKYLNISYYNGSRERQCVKVEKQVNETEEMLIELEHLLKTLKNVMDR